MEKQTFLEIMVFLDGAYARSFPQVFRDVAWGMFQRLDARLVGQAAMRMVESGEEHPSPMKWHQNFQALVEEEFASMLRRQTAARIEERSERLLREVEGVRRIAPPRRPDETDEERMICLGGLIGTADDNGTARADDCTEYMRLRATHTSTNAPRYPGMGLRQILAVRMLENSGMAHEDALREVGSAGKLEGEEHRA